MPSSHFQKSIIVTILKILISLTLLKAFKAIEPIPNFDLSSTSLDPTKTGFTIAASALSGESFGQSVDNAGDIDGDGYDDIVIGACTQNGNKGAVYVIYGGPSSQFVNIDTSSPALDPATTGFTITGNTAGDYFGIGVARAGDINNDGYDDVLIGAHGKSSFKGAVYVIYGGPRSSFLSIDLSATSLNPTTTGFMIMGESAGDQFGFSVNPAGDINKDNYDDIIIGAPVRNNIQGAAYVIYGGSKSSLSNLDLGSMALNPASTGFTLKGNFVGDFFGRWVNTAGDIDGDGYDDIIIGAMAYNGGKGASYVIYGKEKSLLSNIDFSLTTLDPATTGFTITGENSGDKSGISVSTAGDINNDGYGDLLIGAPSHNSITGVVYAIYGGPKSSLSNIDLSLTTLNPATTGFTIKGDFPGNYLGWPVALAGDINGDGFDDIIIGAYGYDNSRGAVYAIYGRPKSSLSNIDLSSTPLDPLTTGFTLLGNAAGDFFGYSVNAGDINNDGYNDIIIGAYSKNSGSGIAYVVHSTCPTSQCDYCISRICQACKAPYFLYQSWCVFVCPTRTFGSKGFCKDCPPHCSSCTSRESCQACDQGFTLSNSQCTYPPSYPSIEAKATQAVASGVRGISSVVNIGSATSPMTALVSKIVQNTRYLNLSVTEELTEIYKTWNTDIISWQVPNAITTLDHYKISPEVFSRYGLASSFVENFWATLMTIILSLFIVIIFYGLKIFLESVRYDNWLSTLTKKLIAGSFNFALVQAYGCFDDILLYLVLDLKTNPFNTFFSWASLVCAAGFLALGCFLVFLNVWKVNQYQGIKKEALAKENMKNLEAFNERNEKWELFYSDFNDSDLWTQSTLALLVIRSSLSSLILTTLYEYPLMQTAFLIILDGAINFFLFFQNPFATLRGKLAQYYFEAITLLVHLCTFILAMQDTFPSSSETLRNILSTSIIYLNTVLVSGSVGFLFVEIYKTISQKRREFKQKQMENNTVREETQDTQRVLPHRQPTNVIHPESEIDSHRKSRRGNHRQVFRPENSRFSPDFIPFTGMNLHPANDYNLTMNTEDSILPDIDSSLRFNNALRPNIRNHFQPRRIPQQKPLSLETNPKRQIRNLSDVDSIN